MTRPNKKNHFAIVDSSSRITSIHKTRTAADEAGWGHDRELVQLVAVHEVGDVIAYGPDGVEITATDSLYDSETAETVTAAELTPRRRTN